MNPAGRDYLRGHIVVWIVQVSACRDALPLLESCLDDRDRERRARLRFPEDRSRFILGRALVRKCLGHHLGESPESIHLACTAQGRPFYPQDETVAFSISHTGDWVALAATADARVGVDVERVRAHFDPLELAPSVLCAEELRAFQSLPAAEKKPVFFRVWTRKEAYLKARGEGITDALQQISVPLGADDPAFLNDLRDPAASAVWRLYRLPIPGDYSGHVACDDAARRLDYQFVRFNGGEVVIDE